MQSSNEDINVYSSLYAANLIEDERQKERDAQRKRQRENYENQVPENLPTASPTQPPPPTTTPSKRRKSDIPQAPVPDLMAPSAIQHNVNILPGAQGAAGKVISQTNKDIVANRKALRMGGNPQTTAVAENKSAADALRAEMGFGGAASMAAPSTPTSTTPMSAKAALKRKAAVMEEETENTESEFSAPATPIPKPTNGAVEDVQDTVRYFRYSDHAKGRLWEPGHKERYYEQKFHVDYHEDVEFRRK
jgi:5'-3' exonuclease